ncbi:MAG: hypothetical protein ABW134_11855 [Candidatus Thiodiazotropha endolucinida]
MADHYVNLHITNNTNIDFHLVDSWYDSGGMNGGVDTNILKNSKVIIPFSPYSAGVSGYCVWWANDGSPLCIAFSNPVWGTNKLGVAIADDLPYGGETPQKELWDDMTNHDYKPFVADLHGSSFDIKANCCCTGGGTNNCTITLEYW